MTDVTNILGQIEHGDPSVAEKLLPLVYDELRKLAAARMADERSDHTLQPTALVHEAYLRLVDQKEPQHWNSRGHFFAAAAEAMRRILIEQARRKKSQKRSFQKRCLPDHEIPLPERMDDLDLLALNEALERLEAKEPEKAQLVKLRFFAGLSLEEAADALNVSLATVKRYWVYARAWLYGQMHGDQ